MMRPRVTASSWYWGRLRFFQNCFAGEYAAAIPAAVRTSTVLLKGKRIVGFSENQKGITCRSASIRGSKPERQARDAHSPPVDPKNSNENRPTTPSGGESGAVVIPVGAAGSFAA